ncbi:hypothetical protein B2J86_13960 [Acidovorax sp. SRB_14]|nr:hypothetical protein [Acidovorax sp. SRB_14]
MFLIASKMTTLLDPLQHSQKPNQKQFVDGQQRLTTITLILASIRNSYRLFGFEDRASGVQNFIERNNKNNEATYVLKTETSHPYFQTAIQRPHSEPLKLKLGEEESLLQSAFQYFSERIAATLTELQAGVVNESTKKSRAKQNSINSETHFWH